MIKLLSSACPIIWELRHRREEVVVNHHQQAPFHLLKDVSDLSYGEPGDGNLIASLAPKEKSINWENRGIGLDLRAKWGRLPGNRRK